MFVFYCIPVVYFFTSCHLYMVTVVCRGCHMVFKLCCTVLYVGDTPHLQLCMCVVCRGCHMVFKLSCTVLYVGDTPHLQLCMCFEFWLP